MNKTPEINLFQESVPCDYQLKNKTCHRLGGLVAIYHQLGLLKITFQSEVERKLFFCFNNQEKLYIISNLDGFWQVICSPGIYKMSITDH